MKTLIPLFAAALLLTAAPYMQANAQKSSFENPLTPTVDNVAGLIKAQARQYATRGDGYKRLLCDHFFTPLVGSATARENLKKDPFVRYANVLNYFAGVAHEYWMASDKSVPSTLRSRKYPQKGPYIAFRDSDRENSDKAIKGNIRTFIALQKKYCAVGRPRKTNTTHNPKQ